MTLPLINSLGVHLLTVRVNLLRIAYNGSNLPEYIGEAPRGSSVNDSVWTINRITYSGNFAVLTEIALRVRWSDYLTADYQ